MDAIGKALQTIHFKIPKEILQIAFIDHNPHRSFYPISIDEAIMTNVIRSRVLIDCNLIGGQEDVISLTDLQPIFTDAFISVFKIPLEKTQGRSIVSVLSISYLPSLMGAFYPANITYGTSRANDMLLAGSRVADAMGSMPPISNAVVDLIGENTILIKDTYRISPSYTLRCILENDENLNNISPRSYIDFAELCTLAVKAYIYNYLLIKLDRAYIVGGQEMSSIKEYIDSLSESEAEYLEFLKTKWKKISMINDTNSYRRFLKLQISPGI